MRRAAPVPLLGEIAAMRCSGAIGTFISCEGLGVEVVLEQREEGGFNGQVWQLPTRLKYPNIKLKAELQADDSLFTQLQRMMQAKQPLPDLVQLDSFYAPPMVENGIAIDMTPYIDRWKNEDAALLEKQAPGMFYKIDDKVVGLITTGTMDVVYYRADWLKEVLKKAHRPFLVSVHGALSARRKP